MNKYWSNEDDNQVSYNSDRPAPDVRPDDSYKRPANPSSSMEPDRANGAFSTGRRLDRYQNRDQSAAQQTSQTPNYGGDRSAFISEEMNTARQQKEEMQFAPPPKFSQQAEANQPLPDFYSYAEDGYEVRTERQAAAQNGKSRRHGWRIALVILLVLGIIGGGVYLFRYQILDLVGEVFGQEVVWKIMPTAAPTDEPSDIPAYVESTAVQAKTKSIKAIEEIADGLPMETYIVTDENIVQQAENQDGTFDYYLFAADDGTLLGYYEGLTDFILCAQDIFYMRQSPYLITAQGYPLVKLSSYARSAGENVVIYPMVNGWALIADCNATMFNFVGTDGGLISDLWFAKAFPFTADTTLGYVDTGNVTDTQTRYALYLLYQNGETERLSYEASIDTVLESVCGMAFMQDGGMYRQEDGLTYLLQTDEAAAYVNCGALVVRDPETQLYGLFVDGVQQYDFEFDSIKPMTSDLQWTAYENGYVTRYAVAGETYPLPRSYSFILKKGDTQQIVSIAASSVYPIVFE